MRCAWQLSILIVQGICDYTFADYVNIQKCLKEQLNSSTVTGPLVPCKFLPNEFVYCEPPANLDNNSSANNGVGCLKFGIVHGQVYMNGSTQCFAMPCVECSGPREFIRYNVPCIKYGGHYFLTTLLYSIFLGWVAVDRFCLGYTAIAVGRVWPVYRFTSSGVVAGKLITLGGLGVWWIIDIILLVTGNLMPEDNSDWEPFY